MTKKTPVNVHLANRSSGIFKQTNIKTHQNFLVSNSNYKKRLTIMKSSKTTILFFT